MTFVLKSLTTAVALSAIAAISFSQTAAAASCDQLNAAQAKIVGATKAVDAGQVQPLTALDAMALEIKKLDLDAKDAAELEGTVTKLKAANAGKKEVGDAFLYAAQRISAKQAEKKC